MNSAGVANSGGFLSASLSIQTKLALAYGLVLVMFTITCLMAFVINQDLTDSRSWVRHTYEVITRLDEIKADMLQQRIDLLTASREPSFLTNYEASRQSFQRDLQELRQLTIDNPSQQRRFDLVGVTMSAWSSAVAQPLLAGAAVHQPTAPDASEYGYAQLEKISSLLDDAVREELQLLRDGTMAADKDASHLKVSVLAMLALALFIGAATILYTRRQITEPIVRLTRLMDRLTSGDTAMEVPNTLQRDEIGALARGLESFRRVKQAADRENWMRRQLLDINAALLPASTSERFVETLLSSLCHLLHAGYGAFFGWDDAQQQLFLRAGFGYSGHADLPRSFKPGEGLVGQCLSDGNPILLSPVPESYLRIGSALGEAIPRILMIYPLKGRSILGVLELASFEQPGTEREQLLTELLRSAGLKLDAIVSTAVTSLPIHWRETECVAMGHAQCRVIGRPLGD